MNSRDWSLFASSLVLAANTAVMGWGAHALYASRMDALRKASFGDAAWLACRVISDAFPEAGIGDEACERAKQRARKTAPGQAPKERED